MTNKTLFDAAEAELRRAGNGVNKVGVFLEMIKEAVEQLAKETGRKAPLSLDSKGGLAMKKHVFGVPEERLVSERMSEKLFSAVHQAVRKASLCWSNVDGAGNYDACLAADIAFDLCHMIADEIDDERDATCGYIEKDIAQRKVTV